MKVIIDSPLQGRTVYKRVIGNQAATIATPSLVAKSSAFDSSRTRPRRLLLCLDGVPHKIIEAARGRGLFEMFGDPARLLSPFPTMTNIALSTMLNASPPLGYESLYFDRDVRRLAGGISKYIGPRTENKKPSSYMDELDYQEPLPCEFLVYVAPGRICFADFHRFAARLDHAPAQKDFFAFLKATDGLLHIRGAQALQTALIELDTILRRIRARYGEETEIVLFSDHGMNSEPCRRVPLRKHLEAHGFKWTSRLTPDDERQVAVPAFGLCSYVALYCANERAANNIAASLASLEGVDFSLTRDGAEAIITGKRGVARINRRTAQHGHVSYSYEARTGDPLDLAAVLQSLSARGALDAEGFASAEAWYDLTARHTYPDALANLYGAIFDPRVAHTADVLLSLEDGFYYGANAFSRLARKLYATHGNALAESSTAFLMSTHRKLPECVRACEAQPLLRG